MTGKLTGQDAEQFRRAIRALKRWKDERFSKDGHAAPKGIALTIAAYHWFQVSKIWAGYDDLDALRKLTSAMLSQFQPRPQEPRLQIALPVSPHSDLCAMMSDPQMRDFKARLQALYNALTAAQSMSDPLSACRELRKQFGDDFPLPDPGRR